MRRRSLLGWSAVVGGGLASGVVVPATAAGAADRERVLANVVESLAGTPESNAVAPMAAKLAAIAATARGRLAALDRAGATEILAGVPIGSNSANLTRTFTQLAEIALATRTPDGDPALVDNLDLQLRVLDAFATTHQRFYADQSRGYYGNWYDWEIGMPTQIVKAFALLAGPLRQYRAGLLASYVDTMDAYLRAGRDGDVDLDSRFHTGANLADITTNRIVQGALLGDDARITKAVADQLTVYATVDPDDPAHGVTDGYYADGSFLQHDSVAYTGSYGKVLLGRSVQTVRFCDGTGWSRRDDLVPVISGWIERGFAPVIFEGWMSEVVKGRAVSRTATGYTDVLGVIESVTDLSGFADDDTALRLRAYVRHLDERAAVPVDPARFVSPLTVQRFVDIRDDAGLDGADLVSSRSSHAFNAMERTVHRRPGWMFALARNSSRISKYETMSGQNLRPWFQGEGAHQIFLSGQDQTHAYGLDHYTCVSEYGLAGTVVPLQDRLTVPESYGQQWFDDPEAGFTSSSENQNTYVYFPRGTSDHSGGAVLDAYQCSAMVLSDDVTWRAVRDRTVPQQLVAYANARAHRSWFCFDDEIVLLAAGISDTTELASPRTLRTTVDTRISDPSDRIAVVGARRDGRPVDQGTFSDLAWALWRNETDDVSVGYVPLATDQLELSVARVSRAPSRIQVGNSETPVTKDVFSLSTRHFSGSDSLAVAVVPQADPAALRRTAAALSVVINTAQAQAVRHAALGMTMINTFDPSRTTRVRRLAIVGAASVIMSERGRHTRLAVSDPTFGRDEITLELRGGRLLPAVTDERATVTRIPGGVRITVDCRSLHGASVEVGFLHQV